MAAVALMAALAGCGGGEDDDNDDGAGEDDGVGNTETQGGGVPRTFDVQAVRALPDQVSDAATFSFEMTVAYVLGTDDGDVEITYRGSLDLAAHQAAVDADITDYVAQVLFPMSQIGAEDEDAEGPPDEVIVPMVADGDVAYAELGVLNDIAGESQRPSMPRWVRYGPAELGDDGSSFAGLVSMADPEIILALLEAAAGEVETVGEEEVRDEPATHLRATIDLAAAREQAPERQWSMIDDIAGEGDARIDEVPVDVWVDEDGLLRRLTVEIDRDITMGTGPPGAPSDAAGAIRWLSYEAFDYGEAVEVEIPDGDDVVDASELTDRESAGGDAAEPGG